MPKISIIAGSRSDLPKMKKGLELLENMGIEYDLKILSAHRTPAELVDYLADAEKKDVQIFIGIAGKAAHLPGVIAAHTSLPVLGVPVLTSSLAGMDSLFSMVQMPSGTPVGVLGINNLENAVIFALQILSLQDKDIRQALKVKRKEKREQINRENELLDQKGWRGLLEEE